MNATKVFKTFLLYVSPRHRLKAATNFHVIITDNRVTPVHLHSCQITKGKMENVHKRAFPEDSCSYCLR